MSDFIDKKLGQKKGTLLDYYRSRLGELVSESKQIFADSEFKQRASHDIGCGNP